MVERPLMVQWVVGSIPHGGLIELFLFSASVQRLVNKGRGMLSCLWDDAYIKEPLLLIGKSSLHGRCGFPLLLFVWSFTICLTPYNRK